jgi:hypothetical protein
VKKTVTTLDQSFIMLVRSLVIQSVPSSDGTSPENVDGYVARSINAHALML